MGEGKARIAVLISGGGTNLQALIDAEKSGILHSGKIVCVISSSPSAYGLTRAENAGIPAFVAEKKALGSQEAFEKAIVSRLTECGAELIVLAGFMSILSADFTARYRDRIINVHPSLIPSFCGKGYYGLKVHEAALAYGVKVTGRHGSFRKRNSRRREDNHAEGGLYRRRRHAGITSEKGHARGGVGHSPAFG